VASEIAIVVVVDLLDVEAKIARKYKVVNNYIKE